jgi:hypothetical protein
MAVSPEPIQQRLANVYLYNLIYIEEEKLPEKIREEFHDIYTCLSHKWPKEGEMIGTIEATTREMSTKEAVDLAERFANLYDELLSIVLDGPRD